MAPKLEALAGVRSGAAHAPAGLIHEGSLLGASRELTAEAKAAGLAKEAKPIESAGTQTTKGVRRFDEVERGVLDGVPGAVLTAAKVQIHSISRWNPTQAFLRLYSSYDLARLTLRADSIAGKLVAAGRAATQSHLNPLQGLMRELGSKNLKGVKKLVARELGSYPSVAAAERAGTYKSFLLDSASYGVEDRLADVELPVIDVENKKGVIKLGTDRVVGPALMKPQLITFAPKAVEGPTELWLTGQIDVRLALEVKGETTATEGLDQLTVLQQRGGRGYAIIGGDLWWLNYEPKETVHIVIAPAGKSLRAAERRAANLNELGFQTEVVTFPEQAELEIREGSLILLDEAIKRIRAAR